MLRRPVAGFSALLLLGGLIAACASTPRVGRCPSDGSPPCSSADDQRVRWRPGVRILPQIEELSGMAVTSDQRRLFVVGERRPTDPRGKRLMELRLQGDTLRVVRRWSVPERVQEVESLAWLGNDRLLLGTETQKVSQGDVLMIASLRGNRIRWRELPLDYEAVWGTSRRRGRGIEAACGAGGMAIIGREAMVLREGRSRMRLAWTDAANPGQWSAITVITPLADQRLGLASLACQAQPDGSIRAWAILRDCDAGRQIVRFELPARPPKDYVTRAIGADRACHDDRNSEAIGVIGNDFFVFTDESTGQPGTWFYRSEGGAWP